MQTVTTGHHSQKSWIALAIFLAAVIGIGALIGTQTAPGEWYQSLTKPPLNPPNWVFGPVWFTLYVMIAVAGWRIWSIAPKSTAMKLWFAQMLLNFAWSPVWFQAEQLWLAFVILVAMWLAIVGFILTSKKHDTIAPLLFVPYLAWVSFAGYLNLSIALLN